METYTTLRQFADSWMLLALVLFFLGVVVWVFRPGSRSVHDDAARSIFRNDTKPARETGDATRTEARR
jgi:cytochrome c oxidase cbb3-type subunit 4